MYQECMVILRFQHEKPLNTDDVRAFLRHQPSVEPIEWCVGLVEDATDREWTAPHILLKAQERMMELAHGTLLQANGHSFR